MKRLVASLVCCILFAVPIVSAKSYKDTQAYKEYLKLPEKYKSPAMDAVYRNGYQAVQKIKNHPCSKGGSIEQFLDKKASIKGVEDLGWITRPYKGGFQIERILLLGESKLIYRWDVGSNGKVKPLNGKAMSLTPGHFKK